MEHLPCNQDIASVLEAQRSDLSRGLTEAEAKQRLQQYGANELAAVPSEPLWKRFFAHFNQLLVWILLAAALLSAALREWIESGAIFAIVILNALLGFFHEERAEQALAALKRMATPRSRVLRDGELRELPSREVVPGDVIELDAGDIAPADIRLVKAYNLSANEAPLTGESLPADKDAAVIVPAGTALGDQKNMCFGGTTVTSGTGLGIVTQTGMQSQMGKIAGMLSRIEQEATPLQLHLREIGKIVLKASLLVIAVVFALQVSRGAELTEVILFSVSLAVAVVPEALSAVVTIALAVGLHRMVRRNAIIRKLPSVETLGCVTVICSDKTGTLTRNEMTVREIATAGQRYEVTGTGYAPSGEYYLLKHKGHKLRVDAAGHKDLLLLLTIGVRCNRARLTPPLSGSEWKVIGDPTEAALLTAAMKAGVDTSVRSVTHENPFDSIRKRMSIVSIESNGLVRLSLKGSTESVLECCTHEQVEEAVLPLTSKRREEIHAASQDLAGKALRVLAFAYKDGERASPEFIKEERLIFVGIVGMWDPPRDEVKDSIRKCISAGIKPIMVTGDHPGTAIVVAKHLGIAGDTDPVVSGAELDRIPDAELMERIDCLPVFARVSPEHKLRILRAWKLKGEVVAMTGDGVNDAPAVQAADIGISMGLTGTEVTKQASDMVLSDDNMASIVNAIEEGRTIYNNIQSVVHYLLASNMSEVLLVLVAALLGWPAPLLAIQILWINFVSDGLPALALAVEKPKRGIMQRRPRPLSKPLLTPGRIALIARDGFLIAAAAIAAFYWALGNGSANTDTVIRAQAVAFCVMAYSQLLFALACRSSRSTTFELGFRANPAIFLAVIASIAVQTAIIFSPTAQQIFLQGQVQFSEEWSVIALLSLLPAALIEIGKAIGVVVRRGIALSGGRSALKNL